MRTTGKAMAFAVVAALLFGWGAAVQAQPFDAAGTHGGTLRVALSLSGAPDINPLTADEPTEWQVIDLLYDSLARIDADTLLPEPWVAESWTVADPLVTVTLRDDVTFHDGSPVQAADVAFTFGASGLGSSVKYGSMLTGLVAVPVDATTVSFDTSGMANPGLFMTEVLTAPILPASFSGTENGAGPFMAGSTGTTTVTYAGDIVISNVSDPANTTSGVLKHHYFADSSSNDAFNADLVLMENGVPLVEGTDYTFDIMTGDISFLTTLAQDAEITADYSFTIEHWTIDAYEGYWSGDAPYLDAVEYTWYPDDPATATVDEAVDNAAKAIIDGSIDLIGWTIDSGDTTDLRWAGSEFETTILAARNAQDKAYIAVEGSPGFGFLYFGYNSDALRPASDPNFRTAITQLINKENAGNIDGAGKVSHSPVSKQVTSWYNYSQATYDAGFKLVGGRPSTNVDAGVFTLDVSGYLDRDGDGWRDDAAGNPMTIDIVGPDFDLNTKWPVITDDFATSLNKAGIRTSVTRMSTWTAIFNDVDNNDIYLGWADGTLDPSFIRGLEPVGRLGDAAITAALDGADGSLDIADRQMYVRQAQGLLGEKLPMQPILSYSATDAHTMQPFTGWVSMPGGVNNFWSYIGLQRPKLGDLYVTVTTDAASLSPGDTADISVEVKDAPQEGANVGDVYLVLSASGGGTLSDTAIWTDAAGFQTVTYTAPSVTDLTEVTVTVAASKAQWGGDTGLVAMTAHPDPAFLTVLVTAGDKVLDSGETTAVTVMVTDQGGQPIANADVTIGISQTGGSVTAASGTTGSTGIVNTTFSGDVTADRTLFKLTATAAKAGFDTGMGSENILVFGAGADIPAPIEKVEQIPSIGLGVVIAALVGVTLLARAWNNREE